MMSIRTNFATSLLRVGGAMMVLLPPKPTALNVYSINIFMLSLLISFPYILSSLSGSFFKQADPNKTSNLLAKNLFMVP